MIYLCLPLIYDSAINLGVHWCGSLQRETIHSSHLRYNEREPPAAANTSNLHSRIVGIDAKLLESGFTFSSNGFGGVECVARLVGLHLITKIFHSLAQSFPCV